MGRAPCCDKANVKRGPWAPEEDAKLKEYIEKHGTGGNWISLPKRAGLKRCGKSCRLRWLNYLRPNLKHGDFSDDEDRIIYTLFATIGSRWSIIAAQLPGRTDNDIKNYWNTKLKKKLMAISDIDPSIYNYYSQKSSSKPQPQSITQFSSSSSSSSSVLSYSSNNMNSYYTSAPSSFSQTLLMMNNSGNNNNDSIMQHYQVNDNVLVFGGGDRHLQTSSTSGSSSDGSINNNNNNNNNQIIIKQENNQLDCHQHQYDYGQMGNLQNYCNYYNGYDEDQNHQKLTVPPEERYHHDLEHQQKSPLLLDYGLEEIKQLISTDNCNSINNILL